MKKLFVVFTMLITTAALATTYTFVVPQKPGGGTSVWAQIVAKELEKQLNGDKIVIKHIPGGRDIPGFNKWENELKSDHTMIMVSHGGNGVSFLQESVEYNYSKYDSIGLMNLNIIAGKEKGNSMENPRFAAGSGMVPEAFAMTLLLCGPNKSVDEYGACFKDKVTWVKGMSGGERRLAFKRGELNGTRENPAAYKKHVESNPNAEIWFHHGILAANGSHTEDINYQGYQLEELFKAKYGVYPSGEFYDSYKLVKSFRDGLQKALWVNKGNPHTNKLKNALLKMSSDSESIDIIQKKVGKYDWIIGEDGNKHVQTLMGFVTEPALKNLVKFNKEYLGLASTYKSELVK